MNEFASYAMQAPLLKRRTRQRFTESDYILYYIFVYSVDFGSQIFRGQCRSSTLLESTG